MNRYYPLLIPSLFFLLTAGLLSWSPPTTSFNGTYMLRSAAGERYELQLVVALDSTVYGTLNDPADSTFYGAPVLLKSITADSLYFSLWYGRKYFTVARTGGTQRGQGVLWEKARTVTLEKTSDRIDPALRATANLVPLDLQAAAPAFTSHKRNGSFYLIGWADHRIYLVQEEPDGSWYETRILYDTTRYLFSSLGLAPDEKRLVAHGTRVDLAREEQEGGSIYLLHLRDDTTIARIEKLPPSVNTPSYDNFPDFTTDGDILFSSWGAAAGKPGAGKGDIYRVRPTADGYRTESFAPGVNTAVADAGPSLDRRGRFLLFHRNRRRPPMSDKIYLSVRRADGTWSVGEQLAPPVNSPHAGRYGPRVDYAGRYLYFTSHHRGQGNLYRIPVAEVPELAPFFAP